MPPVRFIKGTWKGRLRLFRPDRVLLKLNDNISGQDVATLLSRIRRRLGATGLSMRIGRWFAFRIHAAAGVPESIETLLADPVLAAVIDFAEPDFAVRAVSTVVTDSGMPDDPYIEYPGFLDAYQWGLTQMGMDHVWSLQTGNATVLPVVADTGMNTHLDLDDARFLYGGNYLDEPASATAFVPDGIFSAGISDDMKDDSDGHGMQMAAVIAATQDNGYGIAGMNWGSSVGVCRVLFENDAGPTSAVLAAVAQSVERGKLTGENIIINMSFVLVDDLVDEDRFPDGKGSKTLEYACEYADGNGAILICGAGNAGGSEPDVPAIYAATYPDHVMAVGHTEYDHDTAVESINDNSHKLVTVVAPGSLTPVPSLSGGWVVGSGSSIAAAHVTGLASLLWSHRPYLAGSEIVRVLKETAYVPSGVTAYDENWGWGRVDGRAAIDALDKSVVVSMVLDKSGSMNNDSGTTGMTRMDVLKAAADILIHSLGSRSHVGVIGFDSGASEIYAMSEIDPDDPDTVLDEVTERVAAMAPGGNTSIGAGVEAGVAQVDGVPDEAVDGEPARGILLFTDGRENTAPFVLSSSGTPVIDLSSIAHQVHSVATGTSDVVDIDALTELASRTEGTWSATGKWDEESEQAIAKFFIQAVTLITGEESVLDPVGTIRPGDGTVPIEFPLTEDDRRVEVILMRPDGVELSLALRTPTGEVITANEIKGTTGAEYHESGRVVVYRLELPSRAEGRDEVHEGIWTALLEVTEKHTTVPAAGARYTLLVNAVSRLRLQASIRQHGTSPGAGVEVSASVSRIGTSGGLQGIDELEATVVMEVPTRNSRSRLLPERRPGTFRGRSALPKAGVYRIKVEVEGLVNDRPFRHERMLTAATWTEARDPGDDPAASGPGGRRNS